MPCRHPDTLISAGSISIENSAYRAVLHQALQSTLAMRVYYANDMSAHISGISSLAYWTNLRRRATLKLTEL